MIASWNRLKLFFSVNAVSAGVFGITTLGFGSNFSKQFEFLPRLYNVTSIFLVCSFGAFVLAGILYSTKIPIILMKHSSEGAYISAMRLLYPERLNKADDIEIQHIRDDIQKWRTENNSKRFSRLAIVLLLCLSAMLIFFVLLIFVGISA